MTAKGPARRGLTAPMAARMPSAMGRSKEAPSLRTSAGARFTVMRSEGKGKPALRMAVRTRSRLSRTAESGSPTVVNAGSPAVTSTSTRTSTPSTPSSAADSMRASTRRSSGCSAGAVNVANRIRMVKSRCMSRDLRAADAGESPGTMRPVVLIVDDDAGLRESFRLILEDGYELVEASDGRQALEIVRNREVDLVLLDIRLPEMDGIEVLE